MSLKETVKTTIAKVPARRWLDYSTKFGRDTQDVMTDAVLATVVTANELHLAKFGSQSLEHFLDLSLEALSDVILELTGETTDDEAALEGADFRSAGGDVVAPGAGGTAAGLGEGVRAEPGPDLPGDGDSAL